MLRYLSNHFTFLARSHVFESTPAHLHTKPYRNRSAKNTHRAPEYRTGASHEHVKEIHVAASFRGDFRVTRRNITLPTICHVHVRSTVGKEA